MTLPLVAPLGLASGGALAPPSTMVATAGAGNITLTWTAPASGAPLDYQVYQLDAHDAPPMLGNERFVFTMDRADVSPGCCADLDDVGPLDLDATFEGDGGFADGIANDSVTASMVIPSSAPMIRGSVLMWVRADCSACWLFSKDENGQSGFRPGTHMLLDRRSDGRLAYRILDQPTIYSNTIVPVGSWTHIAMTWGEAGTKLYVNGVLDALDPATSFGFRGDYGRTSLGTRGPFANDVGNFDGAFDEVREHSAQLDDATIASLMIPGARRLLGSTSATTFAHLNLGKYDVRTHFVTARYAEGESRPGPFTVTRVTQPGPSSPSNLTVVPSPGPSLTIGWDAPATPHGTLLGYRIERRLAGYGPPMAHLADIGLATTYTDEEVTPSTYYEYQIRAITDVATSGPTHVVSRSTWALPGPVNSLQAELVDPPASARITWQPPTSGGPLTHYAIERAVNGGAREPLATTTDLTLVDAGIPLGSTLEYTVRAMTGNGSGATRSVSIVSPEPPGAPVAFHVARSTNLGELRGSWQPATGTSEWPVTGYRVYSGATPDSLSFLMQTSGTSFVDATLGLNETRWYAVASVSALGEGPAALGSNVSLGPPWRVVLNASPGSEVGAIRLTWAEPRSDDLAVLRYLIYAGDSASDLQFLDWTQTPGYVESGLPVGIRRYYAVSADNLAGESEMSAVVSARTYTAPSPPGHLTVTASADRSRILLRWQAPIGAADAGTYAYRIYRGLGAGDEEPFATVPSTRVAYDDLTCPLAVTCSYYVTALAALGESARSNEGSQIGGAPVIAKGGPATSDPEHSARLVGREIVVYQFDADDVDAPAPGFSRDSAPGQNHAQLLGTTEGAGRFGRGMRFALGEFVTLTNDAATSQLASGTVMMWVKLETPGVLLHKSGLTSELMLGVAPNGSAYFQTREGDSPFLWAPGAVATNEWVHLAVTWGGVGKRILVNGVLVAQDTDNTPVGAESLFTDIGGVVEDHENTGIVGNLDEIRIYSSALTAEMIGSIAGKPYVVADIPVPP